MVSKFTLINKKNFYAFLVSMICFYSSYTQTSNDIMESIRASIRKTSVNVSVASTDPCNVATSSSISLDDAVAADLATIQPNGSWTDIDYTDVDQANTWEPLTHIYRLEQFADAYSSDQSIYYNDTTLYDALVNGLDYYYLVEPSATNWWFNKIKAPRHICRTLILARGGSTNIPTTLENNILSRLDGITPTENQYTGANKADIALWHFYQGLLRDNSSEITSAVNDAYSTIAITTDEGLQHDYSFQQHGPQFLMNYGQVLVSGINAIAQHTYGTPYHITGVNFDNYVNYTLSCLSDIRRGKYHSFSAQGRLIANKNYLQKGPGLFSIAKIINPTDSLKYQDIIDRGYNSIPSGYNMPSENTYYYRSLFNVHKRVDFNFTILANSTRMEKTETGNNQNIKGRFLAEGATNILLEGDEYYNILPVWEWNKIPGTTTPEYTGTDLRPPSNWGILGTSTFSGGVSDGLYGAQVFDMNEYNTQVKKSWFLFDEEVVCLGAGISSSASEKISTTINQCNLDGTVTVSESGSISTLTSDTLSNYTSGLDWILHDSIGYFLPSGGNLKLSNQTQQGSWKDINTNGCGDIISKDVFKLWFDHGVSPTDDTYEYIVVPGKTSVSQMQAYDLSNIEILYNNTSVQAVKNHALDMIQVVFHLPNTVVLDGVTVGVNKACIMILKNVSTSVVDVYISDPSETNVNIDVVLESPSISPMRKLNATMPTGTAHLGSTVNYTFDTNTPEGDLLTNNNHTETFENMTLVGWGMETYIGDSGFSWSVDAKGEDTGRLNSGNSIYFFHGKTGVQSVTITGGIGDFSVTGRSLLSP